MGHPADPPGRRPGPDRILSPPPRPAPADRLALGLVLAGPLDHRHRLTATAQPRGPRKNPTWKNRTDRRLRPTPTPPDEQTPTEILKSRPRNHRRCIRAETSRSATRSALPSVVISSVRNGVGSPSAWND